MSEIDWKTIIKPWKPLTLDHITLLTIKYRDTNDIASSFISEFTDSLDSEFSFISDDEDECENTSLLSDSLVVFSNELLYLETSDTEFYHHDIISETM